MRYRPLLTPEYYTQSCHQDSSIRWVHDARSSVVLFESTAFELAVPTTRVWRKIPGVIQVWRHAEGVPRKKELDTAKYVIPATFENS